jgi:membrane protease YdiL (CAAX protease family)
VRIFERRKANEISFSNATAKDFFLGSIYGLLSFSITALILMFSGMCSINSVNENPTLLTNFFFDFFFAFLQDIVYFAIIFRITEQYLGTFVSIFIAGVIFGFKHLLFPDYTIWGAIAISLEGAILFTALFIKSRNIWMVFGFHFTWNYLANGIFGLIKLEEIQSLLSVKISGPEILAGSQNGLESSIIAMAISLVIGIPYLMNAYRQGNFIRPFWKRLDKRRQKG